jgi:hypothetical protein
MKRKMWPPRAVSWLPGDKAKLKNALSAPINFRRKRREAMFN